MRSFFRINLCVVVSSAFLVIASGCDSNRPRLNKPVQHGGGESTGAFDYENYEGIPLVSLPAMKIIEPGVEKAVVKLGIPNNTPGSADTLYIYRPAGTHKDQSLPCVFIAAAGGTPFTGKNIASADEPEFVPYVKAGFVVVGYETDGEPKNDTDVEFGNGVLAFKNSFAGLVNSRNAIFYSLKSVPEIDPNKLFSAGHSSAGRQALMLAAFDKRIKGSVSFNGVTDVSRMLKTDLKEILESMPEDTPEFIAHTSPRVNEDRIHCPVMLFHTNDDQVVPVDQSTFMASRLKGRGVPVELVLTDGNHYDPMLEEGIPAAIKWLSGLAFKSSKVKELIR